MTTFRQYHDLYLLTDVLLLADVFENFRVVSQKHFDLDPAHNFSAPGLSWDSMLKMTGVQLELLTNPDMHMFFESGIRGGISNICHRHAKANNPLVGNVDPEEEISYILYIDANNLYGLSMSQKLPIGGFQWIEPDNFNINDNQYGYILEVDLEYPSEIHDEHNDFPLAPEPLTISEDELSPFSQVLLNSLGLKHMATKKLVPNLRNKSKYILHIQNLRLYLSLGLKLTKIHRVLQFNESNWLEPYISSNTERRKLATSDFEKDFWKLLNNSCYGKTMENLRKRVNIELVNDDRQFRKLVASPSFHSFKIFSPDLTGVSRNKTSLLLNRPVYAGFTVLELSKVHMMKFHYEYIREKYGNKAQLLATDTDSFIYHIRTQDVYADIKLNSSLFDTSNYPQDHPLFSNQNKKVIGKFSDETAGIPISEFIGLRPKCYSLRMSDGHEKKVAKGVNKCVVKRKFTHDLYKQCLVNNELILANMKRIARDHHNLNILNINKIGLSPADDKRFLLNNTYTVAYGHHLLPQLVRAYFM